MVNTICVRYANTVNKNQPLLIIKKQAKRIIVSNVKGVYTTEKIGVYLIGIKQDTE